MPHRTLLVLLAAIHCPPFRMMVHVRRPRPLSSVDTFYILNEWCNERRRQVEVGLMSYSPKNEIQKLIHTRIDFLTLVIWSETSDADEIDVSSALDFHNAVPQNFRDTERASTIWRWQNFWVVTVFVRLV